MEDLRKYLKDVRKMLGIRQQDLAVLLGVLNSTLSNWEHFKTPMGIKSQKKFIELCRENGIVIKHNKGVSVCR